MGVGNHPLIGFIMADYKGQTKTTFTVALEKAQKEALEKLKVVEEVEEVEPVEPVKPSKRGK